MARLNKKTFKEALIDSGGNQSIIARKLDKVRSTITMYLNKHPKMRKLLETEAERVIDVAENIVDKEIVTNKDLDTAKWKLTNSKRGKARGYGQKQELEHIGDQGVVFNLITKSVEEIKDAKSKRKPAQPGDKPEARRDTVSS